MIAFRNFRLRLHAAQDGMAMIMVIGVGSVMTILIVAALAMSFGTQNKAKTDTEWNGALAAAFAGIEEYQSHLSEEPGYVQYGNPASLFSHPTQTGTATVTLPTGTLANPAFGVGPTGTWAQAEDMDGNPTFKYRYEVDNSKYSSTGNIRLRSTGLVGGETRSVVADLRQTGFIDYLYFTDLEMTDPAIANGGCSLVHTWEGRGGCTIQFGTSDILEGAVHSNDTLYICASRFKQTVTTGKPGGGYVRPSGCALPTFDKGAPVFSPSVPMPATNTELLKETRSDLTGTTVPRPGCLYTGPTQITFLAGGKMNVKSPWTQFTNTTGSPTSGGNNINSAQCGLPSALQSAAGATVNVLKNNVVFVQNIPLTGINSATATQTTTTGSNTRCKNLAGASLTTSAGYSQNVVGYPLATEKPPVVGTDATASYGCRNGDLFISGTNSGGAITLAAQNYIYVTGDLRYNNTDSDMIGLVGNNAIWVHNPITVSDAFINGNNRRIDAALLSVAHTFTVQNYTVGSSRGTLTVYGSIAQKFRGPVGTTSPTGYTKNYLYDPRFRYTAPPKFLSPVTTTYGINVWVEISPVYNVDGTYK